MSNYIVINNVTKVTRIKYANDKFHAIALCVGDDNSKYVVSQYKAKRIS